MFIIDLNLLRAALQEGNFGYMISDLGRQNYMHLGGSKKAANLSQH